MSNLNLALVNGAIMRLKDVEEVGVAEVEKLLTDARAEVMHLESLLAELHKLAGVQEQPAAQPNAPVENAAPAEQVAPAEQSVAPAEQPAVPAAPEQSPAPAVDPNAAPSAPADPNAAPVLQ